MRRPGTAPTGGKPAFRSVGIYFRISRWLASEDAAKFRGGCIFHSSRNFMFRIFQSAIITLVLSAIITGCGGGGVAAATFSATASPSPTPTPIPTTAPTPAPFPIVAGSPGTTKIMLSPNSDLSLGDQIANCSAILVQLQGGTCDATAFVGIQQSNGFSLGAPGKKVVLSMNYATVITSGPSFVSEGSVIAGPPGANGSGVVFQAAPGYSESALFTMSGNLSALQNVVLEGDKGSQNNKFDGLLIDGQRVGLYHVRVMHFPGTGISNTNSQPSRSENINRTCCAKLNDVESWFNDGDGLAIHRSTDWFITLSEFEQNGGNGITIDGSSGIRLEHSDLGGNQDGVAVIGMNAGFEIITGNQFGQNRSHGWYDSTNDIQSGKNIVTGNSFIPNGTVFQIDAMGSGHDNFTGNTFQSKSGCLHVAETSIDQANSCN